MRSVVCPHLLVSELAGALLLQFKHTFRDSQNNKKPAVQNTSLNFCACAHLSNSSFFSTALKYIQNLKLVVPCNPMDGKCVTPFEMLRSLRFIQPSSPSQSISLLRKPEIGSYSKAAMPSREH